jgi:hypothetical protein
MSTITTNDHATPPADPAFERELLRHLAETRLLVRESEIMFRNALDELTHTYNEARRAGLSPDNLN